MVQSQKKQPALKIKRAKPLDKKLVGNCEICDKEMKNGFVSYDGEEYCLDCWEKIKGEGETYADNIIKELKLWYQFNDGQYSSPKYFWESFYKYLRNLLSQNL